MSLIARVAVSALLLVTGPLAASALAQPAPAAVEVPPIIYKTRTLPNGLKVVTSLDRATPNVAVHVWYQVGSKDDPQGRSGFAHLFEHMMFKATANLPPESFDRMTEDVGGQNNASTWDDLTNYWEVVPANHLERLLWAEAERMSSLVVDEDGFRSERDVVKEELRQSYLAQPYGRLFGLYLPLASYTTHPYKRPGIGSIAELDAATIDDVRTFHQIWYRPDNAALIVVGNFDQAHLDAWIDKYYGPLEPPPQAMPRETVKEPARTQPGVFEGYGPNVPLPAVAITWHGASASDPDAAALTVLNAILSSGKSSRLYNSLVYDQQIAVEAIANADLPRDPGLFMLAAIMASGHTIAEGEAALLAEVRALRKAQPTLAELVEAKNELIADKIRGRETINGRAYALGMALLLTGDADRANTEIADLQAVTTADVHKVAAKYLADERRMTIRYRSETERPADEVRAELSPPPKTVASYDGPIHTLAPEGQQQAPPPLAEPLQPILPQPAEATLNNGLRVIVARSSDLPLVTADLTIRTGAWADPGGLAGAVAMTTHMLTEGTRARSAQQIARQIEALGATLETGVGLESASVTLSAITEELTAALEIMADVARNPTFPAEELERQRQRALDGLLVAYQQPGQLAVFAAAPVVFGGTVFGHSPQGTPASIARLTRQDLQTIHGAHFRPDNAVLVLTGNLTPEHGFAFAEAAFGDWTKPDTPPPEPPMVTPQGEPRAVVIDLPGTGQASVNVVKPAIARSDPDYYPGIVAGSVLGGGYSARLNQEIRIKHGLSYGAGASLSTARTTGSFRASAQTKNESAPLVLDLITTEMRKLAEAPPGPYEIQARKSVLVGRFGRRLATSGGLANILGNLALYNVPLGEVMLYASKVEAVRADQVQAFAVRMFDPDQASVIIAGDAKVFSAYLQEKLPTLEVVPAAELDLETPTLRAPK